MSVNSTNNSKLPLDLSKLTDSLREMYDSPDSVVQSSGINGDNIAELNPKFNAHAYEVIYTGKHDSSIVLGRDRAGIFNNGGGYGSLGHTSCASIDIVVGRKSAAADFDIKNNYADPDFITDAARIYLSQKSDIDNYFTLPAGKGGVSVGRSAVGLKADAVRIVGRENLKLVVGGDAKNSQGGNINTKLGVDLIAGDLEKANQVMIIEDTAELQILEIEKGGMQPIPLGINTAFAFDQLVEKIDKLSAILSTTGMILINFMNQISYHTHPELINKFFGVPDMPSEQAIFAGTSTATDLTQYTVNDIMMLRQELESYKTQHLKPLGAYYINSKYHSLN